MTEAVWIAIVSAGGIIVASLLQWLSNRNNNTASENRLRDERQHALALAKAEKEHALQQMELERKFALRDRWLEKREAAYEGTFALANPILELAGFMLAEFMNKDVSALTDKNRQLTNAVNELMKDRPRVEMYGSEASATEMATFVKAVLDLGAGWARVLERMNDGQEPSAEERDAVLAGQWQINAQLEAFRKVAKLDLGTMD